MEILMRRVYARKNATLGILEWRDKVVCTLEDMVQAEKVPGQTAIPAGTYSIKLRTESPMAARYRERFGKPHEGMLWLQDVPGFEWVYIHVGNEPADTDGCILVGTSMAPSATSIANSVAAYNLLFPDVTASLRAGESVTLSIYDSQ